MNNAYMVTNRNIVKDGPGTELATMRYFSTDAAPGKRNRWLNWQELTLKELREELLKEMKDMPLVPEELNEDQKHVSLLVHGYNNAWSDAMELYNHLQQSLYTGKDGLGILVLFTWPSNGRTTDYLADRSDAEASHDSLANLFVALHDHIQSMQRQAARSEDETKLCRAKISVISHSMGNYVIQKALATASKRLNNPQLITLIHQLAMIAADVDNDLFQQSKPLDSDGQLTANLCYRISALYSGLDQVLGASAGLKHFGTRRLGRSGLADAAEVFDNVWDMDVSHLIKNVPNKHSAVFHAEKSLALLADILRGHDRTALLQKYGA